MRPWSPDCDHFRLIISKKRAEVRARRRGGDRKRREAPGETRPCKNRKSHVRCSYHNAALTSGTDRGARSWRVPFSAGAPGYAASANRRSTGLVQLGEAPLGLMEASFRVVRLASTCNASAFLLPVHPQPGALPPARKHRPASQNIFPCPSPSASSRFSSSCWGWSPAVPHQTSNPR